VKIIGSIVSAFFLCVALCAGLLFYHVFYSTPVAPVYPVEVRVEQGDSLATVVRKLRDQKIISNSFLFSSWARLSGAEKKVHPGLYRFESSVAPLEILDRLVTGRGVFQTVTIPEGMTVKEIAELLEKMQVANKDRFLAEASDPALLATLGLQGKGLEGYLFPSTYSFTPSTPEKNIILTMVEQFRKVSLPLLLQADHTNGLSPHEILTLASVIEKETGVDAERPLVSAVFYNRLRLQMPLQSDPTVIYGLKHFDGNLTRKNLNEPTPYNTYRMTGLPPGPICNPSLASIRAAIAPAPVSYLYFVSKNDGTHIFSDTIDAHNRAVKIYQPLRAPAPVRAKSR
jgi:peptidoglycan lytic transglycosylase G